MSHYASAHESLYDDHCDHGPPDPTGFLPHYASVDEPLDDDHDDHFPPDPKGFVSHYASVDEPLHGDHHDDVPPGPKGFMSHYASVEEQLYDNHHDHEPRGPKGFGLGRWTCGGCCDGVSGKRRTRRRKFSVFLLVLALCGAGVATYFFVFDKRVGRRAGDVAAPSPNPEPSRPAFHPSILPPATLPHPDKTSSTPSSGSRASSPPTPKFEAVENPSVPKTNSNFDSLRPTRPTNLSQPTVSAAASPTQGPSESPVPSFYPSASAPPTPPCFHVEINISPDGYPEDTRWTLSRVITIVIATNDPSNTDEVSMKEAILEGSPENASSRHTDRICLEAGQYELAIYDSGGDGLCCEMGNGHYDLTVDGSLVARGGDFGSEEKVSFSVSLAPSPAPIPIPAPTPHPSSASAPSSSHVHSAGPCSICPNGVTLGELLDTNCPQMIEPSKMHEADSDVCQGMTAYYEPMCCPTTAAERPCFICPDGVTVSEDNLLGLGFNDMEITELVNTTCPRVIELSEMYEADSNICQQMTTYDSMCCPVVPSSSTLSPPAPSPMTPFPIIPSIMTLSLTAPSPTAPPPMTLSAGMCSLCHNGVIIDEDALLLLGYNGTEIADLVSVTCPQVIESLKFYQAVSEMCREMTAWEAMCCPTALSEGACSICPDGVTVDENNLLGLGYSGEEVTELLNSTCPLAIESSKTYKAESNMCRDMRTYEFTCCPTALSKGSCSICPEGVTVDKIILLDLGYSEAEVVDVIETTCPQIIERFELYGRMGSDMCNDVTIRGVYETMCCPSPPEDPCDVCPDGVTVDEDALLLLGYNGTGIAELVKATCPQVVESSKLYEAVSETCQEMATYEALCCPTLLLEGTCSICLDGITVDENNLLALGYKETDVAELINATCPLAIESSKMYKADSDMCQDMRTFEFMCCPTALSKGSCSICPNGVTVDKVTLLGLGYNKKEVVDVIDTACPQVMERFELYETMGSADMCNDATIRGVYEAMCCPSLPEDPCALCPGGVTIDEDALLGLGLNETEATEVLVLCADGIRYSALFEVGSDACRSMEAYKLTCCPTSPEYPCSICPYGVVVDENSAFLGSPMNEMETVELSSITCLELVTSAMMYESGSDTCEEMKAHEVTCCPTSVGGANLIETADGIAESPLGASSESYPLYLSLEGPSALSRYGSSVSVSVDGGLVAVGAAGVAGEGFGTVYLYSADGADRSSLIFLQAFNGRSPGDEFGSAVALSGDGGRLVIGSRSEGGQKGAARIYQRDDPIPTSNGMIASGAGTWWSLMEGGIIPGLSLAGRVGWAVSISADGNVVAVSSPTGGSQKGGYVLAYKYDDGTNGASAAEWVQHGSAVQGLPSEAAGYSTSLSGDGSAMAVGFPKAANPNRGASRAGKVVVYFMDGTQWRPLGRELFGQSEGDMDGTSVAMSRDGSVVVVGGRGWGQVNMSTGEIVLKSVGCCRVYKFQSGEWESLHSIVGGSAEERLGMWVAISPDGNVAACGGVNAVNKGNATSGVVRLWNRVTMQESAIWPRGDRDDVEGAAFGASLALSGNGEYVIVGAPAWGGGGASGRDNTGAIQVFANLI